VLFFFTGALLSLMSELLHRSARREAAARLEAERMAHLAGRALDARERILAVVAHDLRNPLSAISLAAAALTAGAAPGMTGAELERRAGAIQRSVARMDRLIGDLLDSAMLDSGQLPIQTDLVEIGALLSEAIEAHNGAAAAKQLVLLAAPIDPGLRATCDRQRVLQALSNLIGNAIKFTPRGGAITVRAEPLDAWISCVVSDTGPGISSEKAAHVFEWFWHEASAAGGGTGLGLSITKGIVEAHGGTIDLSTEPGSGATFRFTLPRAPTRTEPPSPAS
jgi:signal transduction histidine kinase